MPPRKRQAEAMAAPRPAKLVRTGREEPVSKGASRNGSAVAASRNLSSRNAVNDLPTLPTTRLNVYVFGSGTICELGLGPAVTEVKRPRLNPLLPVDSVGIVTFAVGGAHVIAIDYEGRLWSWGQNDSGVLGRDSSRPADEDEDEEDDDNVNRRESTPARVQGVPEDLVFVTAGASDNCSAAITQDGQLYAWGTFTNDGDKAFKRDMEGIQPLPVLVSEIKGAVQVVGGKDHLLVLDRFGHVWAWGVGMSFQLGHEVRQRGRTHTFGPFKISGLRNVRRVACGEYHSFALDSDGVLWSWGLNNFGQCFQSEPIGDGAVIKVPTRVTSIEEPLVQVDGGNHHSIALGVSGSIYTVGEMNFRQAGIPSSRLPASTVYEKDGTTPLYVPEPVKLVEGELVKDEDECELPKFKFVTVGTDHCVALAQDGSIWTWGFGAVFQVGHGPMDGDENVAVPTKIDNTASRGVDMVLAGAGGQFSVVGGLPK